jgi:hypothetical protein
MQVDMFGGSSEPAVVRPPVLDRCQRTLDMFDAAVPPPAPTKSKEPAEAETAQSALREQHTAAIEALPEVLRPRCEAARPVPTAKAQLDEWTRESQRKFLLWMIGALSRGMYTASSMTSLPGVLQKLNGLGGEW